jgi:hypothetical protein
LARGGQVEEDRIRKALAVLGRDLGRGGLHLLVVVKGPDSEKQVRS